MKIAIDESPISDARKAKHKVRGVGYYLKNLKENLEREYPDENFIFFSDIKELSSDIDIIHFPYFEPFFVSLPKRKKTMTIVTVHDVTPLVLPDLFPIGIRGRLKWEIQKRRLQSADMIITDSQSSKKDIERLVGIDSEKIEVVYLAASDIYREIRDKSQLVSIRKKYKLPEKFVLYVGDATPNKNLPRLIRAVQKINIPLVLVGKALVEDQTDHMNPWNQDLVMVQNTAKKDPLLIRLGFVPDEDLPAIYNLATVFAMPSLYEGFGLPLLEALGCGTPVVTTKEGSIPEVVGDAAYFVDAYSSDSLSQGLQRVLDEDTVQKALVEKGLKQALKFSWKKTAQKTYKTYQKMI